MGIGGGESDLDRRDKPGDDEESEQRRGNGVACSKRGNRLPAPPLWGRRIGNADPRGVTENVI